MMKLLLCKSIWSGEGRTIDAVLVEGSSIVWTGNRTELGPVESDTEVLELGDAFMCPGLVDTHVHFIETGISLRGCDLRESASIKEIQERLSAHKGSSMILASGYDDTILAEKRFLCAADLDVAVKDRPVFVSRRDGHSCVLNTMALWEVNLPPETQGICLDENGNMTGMFKGDANQIIRTTWHRLIPLQEKMEGCMEAAHLAHQRGATGCHALEGGWFCGDGDVEMLLRRRHEIPFNLTIYHQIMDVGAVVAQGLPRIGGCLLLDGSFGSRSAALDKPYHDGIGDGNLYMEDEVLSKMVWEATAQGLQCAVHAIGERAIDQALRVYEKAAGAPACRALRHRIEHFELPRPEHIEKAAQLGICLGMQPAFERYWGGEGNMYEMRLGPERRKQTNPFRSILDKGIRVGFGSDSDITPLDPMLGMGAACTHPTEEQRVKPIEALRAYTVDAARISRTEEESGVLSGGCRSDITVLARNPLAVPGEEIEHINVLMTMVGGEIVFWNSDVAREMGLSPMKNDQ